MIKIFTHVGLDPRSGGGVAAYTKNLKAILDKSGKPHELICVSQFSKVRIVISFLQYFLSKKPVLLNSAFHPFSLLMILFSRSSRLIIMPHGEFLDAALAINSKKKVAVLNILKFLIRVLGLSKNVTIIASSEMEAMNFSKWVSVSNTHIVQDVIYLQDRAISNIPSRRDEENPLHIIMVGRMVRMKGFHKVLDEIAERNLIDVSKVLLYYVAEDPAYLAAIEKRAQSMRRSGIEVELRKGRNADQIFLECKKLNALLIVPSDFESFGYVLIENLWMPNRPIVSFQNKLTNYLAGLELCKVVDGKFAEAIAATEVNDPEVVRRAVMEYTNEVNSRILSILYEATT